METNIFLRRRRRSLEVELNFNVAGGQVGLYDRNLFDNLKYEKDYKDVQFGS